MVIVNGRLGTGRAVARRRSFSTPGDSDSDRTINATDWSTDFRRVVQQQKCAQASHGTGPTHEVVSCLFKYIYPVSSPLSPSPLLLSFLSSFYPSLIPSCDPMSLSVRPTRYDLLGDFDLTNDLTQEAPPYLPKDPLTYKFKPVRHPKSLLPLASHCLSCFPPHSMSHMDTACARSMASSPPVPVRTTQVSTPSISAHFTTNADGLLIVSVKGCRGLTLLRAYGAKSLI